VDVSEAQESRAFLFLPGFSTLWLGLAHRPQRRWLLSSHDNQHDTPFFLKSLLNFFVGVGAINETLEMGNYRGKAPP
jgi:hypothetical protein